MQVLVLAPALLLVRCWRIGKVASANHSDCSFADFHASRLVRGLDLVPDFAAAECDRSAAAVGSDIADCPRLDCAWQ